MVSSGCIRRELGAPWQNSTGCPSLRPYSQYAIRRPSEARTVEAASLIGQLVALSMGERIAASMVSYRPKARSILPMLSIRNTRSAEARARGTHGPASDLPIRLDDWPHGEHASRHPGRRASVPGACCCEHRRLPLRPPRTARASPGKGLEQVIRIDEVRRPCQLDVAQKVAVGFVLGRGHNVANREAAQGPEQPGPSTAPGSEPGAAGPEAPDQPFRDSPANPTRSLCRPTPPR